MLTKKLVDSTLLSCYSLKSDKKNPNCVYSFALMEFHLEAID